MDIIDYKQDLFIYITTEHYTFKEFYSVIINTSTFKKSTCKGYYCSHLGKPLRKPLDTP